jgi:integrase
MLEVHRVRVAQARAESAAKQADKHQAKLEKTVSMRPELRAELERQIADLRLKAKDLTLPRTGPIFATGKDTPLNMNNLLNRQILPAVNHCATCRKPEAEHACEGHEYKRDASRPAWRGWHSFRRGLATNLKRLGVDLKTIQAILRHAHISVTADIYVKEVSEDAIAAMQKLEAHVIAELKKAAKPDLGSDYYADRMQDLTLNVVQKPN